MRAAASLLSLLAFVLATVLPRVTLAEPLALDWDAPDGCPQESDVEALVAQRLGEHSTTSTPRLSASGRVTRTPTGFLLTLTTPTGDRRLESTRCDELAHSAAVILALLIDPRALPAPVGEREAPEPEPPPEALSEAPSSVTYTRPFVTHWFLRAELVGDVGLLPRVSLGPGMAGGVVLHRTSLEIAGTYFPGQDVRAEAGYDVADLRAFSGRLGACQALLGRPTLGPCGFIEYTRMTGRGDSGLDTSRKVDATVWSLLAAARLGGALSASFGWMLEVGVAFPLEGASFRVGAGDAARSVHRTAAVLGRARAGIELRF